MNTDEIIKSFRTSLIDTVLNLIQSDPHQWTIRPCPTCRAISNMIDKPFGCILYAQEIKLRNKKR